eukprot:COSAG02_NODE_505_length_20935_cov_38.509119_23_plen_166_part_00
MKTTLSLVRASARPTAGKPGRERRWITRCQWDEHSSRHRLPAEGFALAATEVARVAVVLGVPGIAVMDVVQLASSVVDSGEKVKMLLGLVGARFAELATADTDAFETPGSVLPSALGGSPAVSFDARSQADPSAHAGELSVGGEASPGYNPNRQNNVRFLTVSDA